MSVQAITWALSFDVETASEKAILLVLANYADGAGVCFPGQENIAKQAACSERTVRRILESFEQRGIITRIERRRRDGSRTSDSIFLTAFAQPDTMTACGKPTGHPVQTNRPSCPNQPAMVSGLTTFEPSGDTSGEPRERATRLPPQWTPDPDDVLRAAEQIGEQRTLIEIEKFHDYWRAVPGAKGRKLDWSATFRNWIRRAAESKPRHDRPDAHRPSKLDHFDDIARAMAASRNGAVEPDRGDRFDPGVESGGRYLPPAA